MLDQQKRDRERVREEIAIKEEIQRKKDQNHLAHVMAKVSLIDQLLSDNQAYLKSVGEGWE